MNRPRLACLVIAALGFALPADAHPQGVYSPHDQGLQIRGGALILDAKTDLSVGGRVLKGSVISLEDDLGLPREPSVPYFELAYGVAFRLHFGFMYSIREGDERQDGNTRFNGHIIGVAGDTLEGRSELLTADFMLGSTIYRAGAIRVEVLTGGKFVHLKNRITTDNPTANPRSSTDVVDVPAFYIGFGGHVLLSETLTFYARYLYTQFAWDVFDVERFFYIDLTLGFTYMLVPGISVSVDYRLIRLEITEDNSGHESDYDLYGNGVGITLLLSF